MKNIALFCLTVLSVFGCGFAWSAADGVPDAVRADECGGKMRYAAWHNDYHQSFVYKIFMKHKGKPEIQANLDQALEIIRLVHAYSAGIHQIVYLVGWQYDGHDSKYPAWDNVGVQCKSSFSDDPRTSLRAFMCAARPYNADVSLHVCINDAYENSPLWETYVKENLICRGADGRLVKGGVWGGEQSYPVSHAKEMKRGFAQKRILGLLDLLPELRQSRTIHIDALFGVESPFDKISIAEDVKALDEMVDFWHAQGIDVTTEFVPSIDQIGYFPFVYHLNLDERLKVLHPASEICGGPGWNTRLTQNYYNKEWRGMMPLPGCAYEEAWGKPHWGDMTALSLKDKPRLVERLFKCPILAAYYNQSPVTRHGVDAENYVVEHKNGVTATVRMRDRTLTVRDGSRIVHEGQDYFLDFARNGGLILAYSGKGCDRTFALPKTWSGVRRLAGTLQPSGKSCAFDVTDSSVRLALPPRTGAVLRPIK